MFKGKQLIYSLIAAAVVTFLTGAGAVRRVDRWMQDALFQKPGTTSSDILIIGMEGAGGSWSLSDLGPECHGVCAGSTGGRS